jgi:hypothetical protein
MAVRMSVLCIGRTLLPRSIIFLLLVPISLRGRVNPQGLVWPKWLGQLKKFNDLIRNWMRDLPACSIASQPSIYIESKRINVRPIIGINGSSPISDCRDRQLVREYLERFQHRFLSRPTVIRRNTVWSMLLPAPSILQCWQIGRRVLRTFLVSNETDNLRLTAMRTAGKRQQSYNSFILTDFTFQACLEHYHCT